MKLGNFIYFIVIFLLISFSTSVDGASLAVSAGSNHPYKTDSHLEYLESLFNVNESKSSKYQNGLNLIRMVEPGPAAFTSNNSYFGLLSMEGKFLSDPLYSPSRQFSQTEWLNSTTVATIFSGSLMIWNLKTNETQYFDFAFDNQHHGFVYNPVKETFLALERYNQTVQNGTGHERDVILDKITEYDLQGEILWEWFAYDSVNYTLYEENLVETNRTPGNVRYNGSSGKDVTHGIGELVRLIE